MTESFYTQQNSEILEKLALDDRALFPVWSCEDFPLEVPEGHPFPNKKYPILESLLKRFGFDQHITRCGMIARQHLELVHTPDYIDRVLNLQLSADEFRRVGFPSGRPYIERALASVEGTLSATREILEHGQLCSGVLAGGTHHAFSDRGEGYCTFNDIAVSAAFALRHSKDRILIVDLDAHQGNGTASIFQGEPRVFTFSMHAEENYPRQKERSSLDIGLPLGTSDSKYMQLLTEHLPVILEGFKPDLVFFQSGVDVLGADRFGRLGLTSWGQYQRDSLVFECCFARRIPCIITLGGGYQRDHAAVAHAHAQTFLTAAKVLSKHQ